MPTKTENRPDALLTLREVAAWLGVSEATLHSWRYRGEGPAGFRLNKGRVRYRRSDVERWLAEQADDRDPAA